MIKLGDIWFRFEERCYASYFDEWSESRGPGRIEVSCIEFKVSRLTARCVFLTLGYGCEYRVLLGARKRFACATKEEALASFFARKRRQISILEAQLRRARQAISDAEWRFARQPEEIPSENSAQII